MSIEIPASAEIARFLASGPTPEQINAYHPSQEATERLYALIEAEKNGDITDEERAELDTCMSLEPMMRLVKIEARRILQQRAS
jgi:hypothetical protein